MNWTERLPQIPAWTGPLALLVVSVLAFGLLIPSLGFYFDDWVNLYVLHTGGDLWDYLRYDRPFSAWTFIVTEPILGTRPLNWHIFTLVIRWLGAVGMWWTLRQVWPRHKHEVTWMALLFAVHPVFAQQSIALTYSQNFITYALFFLSMGSMLAALRNPGRFWPFTGLAIVSGIIHIFTMEYFWGLELLRPVFIWILLSEREVGSGPRLIQTLRTWGPYALILVIAILWRETITAQLLRAAPSTTDLSWNELSWFGALFSSPVQAVLQLIERILQDFSHLMFASWYKTIQPELFDLESKFLVGSWLLVIASATALTVYLRKLHGQPQTHAPAWKKQSLLIGSLVYLLGTFPIWAINKNITLGMFSDRFALPAMFGAAILIVGTLSHLKLSFSHKTMLIGILVGLSIGTHFRTANDFRWAWIKQQRFFWQLHWRAPNLEPGTALLSSGSVFTFTGDYPTAFAINLLYDRAEGSTQLPYWFFELDRGFHQDPRPYLRGKTLSDELRNYSFSGSSLESIAIHYDYDNGSCLWVLDQTDGHLPDLPDLTRAALPMSDLNRIGTGAEAVPPSNDIFGDELAPYWCYYYQKAEIARRDSDWQTVISLAKEIEAAGFSPNNKLEWLPFIEGYIQTGKPEKARDLTLAGFNSDPQTAQTFCRLWKESLEAGLLGAEAEPAIDTVYDTLRCNSYEYKS